MAFSALAAIVFSSEAAMARVSIGADLDPLVIPFDGAGNEGATNGAGVALRLGSQIRLPMLALTPELALGFNSFGSGPDIYRGLGGLRLGLGEVLRPGVMAHVGAGSSSHGAEKYTALSYDAGVFLDFTLLPLLDIGGHASYNYLAAGSGLPAFDWGALGVHANLVF